MACVCVCVCVCVWCVCVCVKRERKNMTQPLKKNEILPFIETWMDLEDIVQSEISQTEKDKYCMISLICGI